MVDDPRKAVLSIVDVELPDGVRFEQCVLRLPAAATVVVHDVNQVLGADPTGATPDINEAAVIEWISLSEVAHGSRPVRSPALAR